MYLWPQLSKLSLLPVSASADAEPEESLPTLTREELEGVDKETVMVSCRFLV